MKSYTWLIIPVIVFIFLYEMMVLGKIPMAGDTISYKPIQHWTETYENQKDGFPQWFPHFFGGMPSYGSLIHIKGDPTRNLLQGLSPNRGVRYWLHFVLGGAGVFFLIRRRKMSHLSAVFGGLAFALTPYMFGLINAGHSSKIIAIGYIPWVFMAADYCVRTTRIKGILFLGLLSAIQLWSNHPQIVYYTWMLVFFWWVWNQVALVWKKKWSWKEGGLGTGFLFGGLILSLLIVSDPYISVFQFQKYSNRGAPSVLDNTGETESGTKWDYATQWSFHPKETLSFLYPYHYGLQNYPTRDVKSAAYWGYMPFTQSTHYVGLLLVLLAVLGALLKKPDRMGWFLWISAGLILLVGFGNHFPVLYWPLYTWAPYFAKFRIPSMIYILLAFNFSILAAQGLDTVLDFVQSDSDPDHVKLRSRLLSVFGGFIGITLLLFLFGDSFVSFIKVGYQDNLAPQIKEFRVDQYQKGLLLALFVSGGGFTVLWLALKKKLKAEMMGFILIGLSLTDLWVVDREFLVLKSPVRMKQQFRPDQAVNFLLDRKDQHFRIFPMDELNTNWYAYFGLSSIGGYRALKLRSYQDLMDSDGFNNLNILNMLNVKYILTGRDMKHPNFPRVFNGKKRIYENSSVLPRAWLVGKIISVTDQRTSLESILDTQFDPSREAVIVNYNGPEFPEEIKGEVSVKRLQENIIELTLSSSTGGILVLSEMYYQPGWKAWIDGDEKPVLQTNHVLRSVLVTKGEHNIIFRYDDTLWKISVLVSRIMFFGVIAVLLFIYQRPILSRIRPKP